MLTPLHHETADRILAHYGAEKQKIQAVQELSELILLLTRRADQITSRFREDVTSELADCYIMLRQVQTMYGITDAAVTEQIDRKELRQLERIDREILHYDP